MLDTFEEKSSRQADNVSSEEESDQEGDETGRLLRATVDELQKALEDSRSVLSQRDAELNKLRSDLEQHRKQVMSLLPSYRRGSQVGYHNICSALDHVSASLMGVLKDSTVPVFPFNMGLQFF